MQNKREHLSQLRRILTDRFSEGELKTLCFDLGVDIDNLPGETKADKARELIVYFERRDSLDVLINVGERIRPDIEWAQIRAHLSIRQPTPYEKILPQEISPGVVNAPYNMSFELPDDGWTIPGWGNSYGFVDGVSLQYKAVIEPRTDGAAGKCLHFYDFGASQNDFGSLMQRCSASALQSKEILLEAQIKCKSVNQ